MNIYDNIFNTNKEFILFFVVLLLTLYLSTNHYMNTKASKEGFFKGMPKIRIPRIPSPEELFKKALKKVVNPSVKKMKSEILNAANKVKSTAYKVQSGVNKVASKAQGVKTKSVDKLNSIVNDIRSFANRAINFLKNIGKYFAEAMQGIINVIAAIGKQTLGILGSIMVSVKNMFESIGKGLVTAIIKPFLTVFLGIKNIFSGIFGVLMTVVEKLLSLTNCFPIYMFDGMKRAFLFFYNAITPKFLKVIISFIINYIIYTSFTTFIFW